MNAEQTYTWRTDAASGDIDARDADQALARLIKAGEWPAHDACVLADGAFLRVWDDDNNLVIEKGQT